MSILVSTVNRRRLWRVYTGSKVIFTILESGEVYVCVYKYCFCEFRMVKRKNLIDTDSGESDESGSDLDSVSLY